jgi:hypothetical protein
MQRWVTGQLVDLLWAVERWAAGRRRAVERHHNRAMGALLRRRAG